ncbi:2-oxoglutarate and fe-dependent oxygenase-like protein [Quillaja saponaria]|uniref:2-oxoglutarate and fe-dependent oxygenase-like protein n=1 Tax=Quillaja saponaria TaxID=32244 RepID=A0AAD7M0C6_QUISA|nr:2-oxoglutarate and fe-dependent oxygenase-like protein [Quillaja saponaria]
MLKKWLNLAFKLMELIALSLNLPAKRFVELLEDHGSYARLNHYPPCPSPDLALGVGRHKDGVALTILAQDDVGGLEVKRKSDGEWVLVKPTPDSYIINVGDIIQVPFSILIATKFYVEISLPSFDFGDFMCRFGAMMLMRALSTGSS